MGLTTDEFANKIRDLIEKCDLPITEVVGIIEVEKQVLISELIDEVED